jgi:hypothetical protein
MRVHQAMSSVETMLCHVAETRGMVDATPMYNFKDDAPTEGTTM